MPSAITQVPYGVIASIRARAQGVRQQGPGQTRPQASRGFRTEIRASGNDGYLHQLKSMREDRWRYVRLPPASKNRTPSPIWRSSYVLGRALQFVDCFCVKLDPHRRSALRTRLIASCAEIVDAEPDRTSSLRRFASA